MEVSGEDIKRLEEKGYCRRDFCFLDHGVVRLRNIEGSCYFYSPDQKRCKVYEERPMGCSLYPVVHLVGGGTITDDLCPNWHTISQQELKKKGTLLKRLLKTIDRERLENKTLQ